MGKKKRIADWLEKMSAAFIVGALVASKGFLLPFIFGIGCLVVSLYLTDKEK